MVRLCSVRQLLYVSSARAYVRAYVHAYGRGHVYVNGRDGDDGVHDWGHSHDCGDGDDDVFLSMIFQQVLIMY